MKRILILTAILVLACSSDDSSDTNDDNNAVYGPLPETINYYRDAELIEQANFIYNQNQVSSINVTHFQNWSTVSNRVYNYLYGSSGLINQIEGAVYNQNQEVIESNQVNYLYNDFNDVQEVSIHQDGYTENFSITYPENNEIHSFSDAESCTDIYYVNNGNVTQFYNCSEFSNTELTYDNKNSIYKNIKGNNLFSSYPNLHPLSTTNNNRLISLEGWNLNYTYNEENYPIKIEYSQCSSCETQKIEITYTN